MGMEFYWVLIILAILIPIIAQINVKRTFKKYKKVRNSRGITGEQTARMILDNNGLYNVPVERVGGNLTDHYDPLARVLRLSSDVYSMKSVAAVGIAAHEAGHAIQHAEEYSPMTLRTSIAPIVRICSKMWYLLIMFGIILEMLSLIKLAIILFSAIVVFQIITLPVEFDASRRAGLAMESSAILEHDELTGAKRVLSAAAMTYVAALLASILQLIRLLAMSNRRR